MLYLTVLSILLGFLAIIFKCELERKTKIIKSMRKSHNDTMTYLKKCHGEDVAKIKTAASANYNSLLVQHKRLQSDFKTLCHGVNLNPETIKNFQVDIKTDLNNVKEILSNN